MDKKLLDTELEFAARSNDGEVMDLSYQLLRTFIIENNVEDIKELLNKNEKLVNSPILINGYTALHLSCIIDRWDVTELLVKDYNADVNVVAEDGTQPIHLASFFWRIETMEILLEAGGNIDAKITKDMHSKYKKISDFLTHTEWCSDFGNTTTLVTFYIAGCKLPQLAYDVIELKANLNVTSLTNKTLLMYACIKGVDLKIITNANNLNDPKIVNARDNDGFTAAHHLLRSDWITLMRGKQEIERAENLVILESWGADINATVNGDPDTFLLNIAASRSRYRVLDIFLPRYFSIKKSKALRNVLPTLEDFDGIEEYFFDDFPVLPRGPLPESLEYKVRSVTSIIKDLINRLTFGLLVPEEEKKWMNKLIEKHGKIEELVHSYQEDFINGVLKTEMIQYSNKSITYYDLISLSINNRKLRLLIKDQTFFDAYKKSNLHYDDIFKFCGLSFSRSEDDDHTYFCIFIKERIEQTLERIKLLEELRKVGHLRKALPLPYEIVLEIIEYIDNNDFKNFIKAFVSN